MALTLIYETHATTTDNERGIATGWLPGELSAIGIENAQALGERRRHDGLSAVYTSDLRRSVQTADIAFAGCSVPVIQDLRLRECDYGDWNGLPRERWQDPTRFIDTPFPHGESYLQVVERTRGFLGEVLERHDGERILVIAHSANRWALDHLVKGVDLRELIARPFDWQPGWEYEVRA